MPERTVNPGEAFAASQALTRPRYGAQILHEAKRIFVYNGAVMPALDRYHRAVGTALQKDGWTITDDPLTLQLEDRTFYVDYGAERLIAAEKGTMKIAVEVKTFGNPSPIADLEQALGQFGVYEEVLRATQPERMLYLAIPEEAFLSIFSERIGQLILQNRISRAFCFSPEREEIVHWIS